MPGALLLGFRDILRLNRLDCDWRLYFEMPLVVFHVCVQLLFNMLNSSGQILLTRFHKRRWNYEYKSFRFFSLVDCFVFIVFQLVHESIFGHFQPEFP